MQHALAYQSQTSCIDLVTQLKSKKIQNCADNIHHHKPVSKISLEFRLRCVPYSTK
jgi:hypothetical protein